MASTKARMNKRSSGNSCASTVTTITFIALCVLGVWMLTSKSIIPQETTSRVATTTTNPSDYSSSSKNSHQTQVKNSAVFEDNPGQLPEDAIKPEDSKSKEDRENDVGENSKNEEKQDNKVSEKDSGDEGKDVEDNVQKNQGSGNEENPQGLQGKESLEEQEKQKQGQNHISEESTMTQIHEESKQDTSTKMNTGGEDVQQTRNDQESKGKREETHNNIEHHQHQTLENQELYKDQHHTTQKEEKQMEEHQQQRKKDPSEDDNQETSHDQTEHDDQRPQETGTIPQSPETTSENQDKNSQHESNLNINSKQKADKLTQPNSDNSYLGGANSGIPKESKESKKSWSTQADQSENQKERRKGGTEGQDGSIYGYTWQLCNVTAGKDYIPCLDNEEALKKLHTRKHYEHRERHCPVKAPTCLVPLPEGYKRSIEWPHSRDKIWYHNVPHTLLAEVKGHQNWVKVTGEFLTFPGGGTQFIHGALHYIDFVQETVPDIAWGKRTRVILDVGCGVASFGGFLFDRDVLAMSFAPKDEHEAQIQFALERGIPAISAVMGTQRLQFPSMVFDLVHCARCRVPWHVEGGALLLELNRVLRPGGYFVWSATPVYQTLEEDVEIWKEMSALTKSMCWELVAIKKDKINSAGLAVYRKPTSNECYEQRKQSRPPICKIDDDPNAAWYVALQSCMHRVPENEAVRGSRWPENWPHRLQTPPSWLNKSQMGIYGKPAPDDFMADYEHWKGVVSKTYLSGLGISWGNVRNVMDMRAVYGGFAAAMKDLNVWVMNVVNIDSPDTLPIVYERGLFGIYHDWCESFSTYPRTYDLLHADHLFSRLKKRCTIIPVMAEIDRIVRPGGKLIVRDESSTIGEVENILKSLHWEVHLTFSKNQEGLLSAQKSEWRPDSYATAS